MELVLSGLVATLVTLPILSYMIIFIMAKKWTKNHRRSVQIAMDLSTIFFIVSVHYLILAIWDKHLILDDFVDCSSHCLLCSDCSL